MTKPISVGVDGANVLRDRRGIGRYVRSLLRVWKASFTDRIGVTILLPDLFPRLLAARLARALDIDDVRVARRAHIEDLHLLWYPWNGMTWVPRRKVPTIVTLHDVWPFVSPAPDRRRRSREQSHYLTAAANADRFIAVSRFTAREAASYLHVDPARIDVVPNGVDRLDDAADAPAHVDGVDRYLLFVGEVEPRKGVDTLIDAMSMLPEVLRRTTALVIAGRSRGRRGAAHRDMRIEWTGEVSDARLASLYAGAGAFVFPSRYEGFGLPVLEAMRYGAPVVASDAAAIPEAAGDAALYFPSGDAAALSRAIERVLTDDGLSTSLAAAGRERATAMTHERCARETLEVFERVVKA